MVDVGFDCSLTRYKNNHQDHNNNHHKAPTGLCHLCCVTTWSSLAGGHGCLRGRRCRAAQTASAALVVAPRAAVGGCSSGNSSGNSYSPLFATSCPEKKKEWEDAEYVASRGRKTDTRVHGGLRQHFSSRPSTPLGGRPQEPGLKILDAPVPQMGYQLSDVLKIIYISQPVFAEQVIEVPAVAASADCRASVFFSSSIWSSRTLTSQFLVPVVC